MPHETPIPISVMQKSLAIAMHYLMKTGQAYPLSQTRHFCAEVIYQEWNAGRRHPVWLANKAIGALQRAREAYWFHILYEPVTASAEARGLRVNFATACALAGHTKHEARRVRCRIPTTR